MFKTIGWLVLTDGPNGWQDDWDGKVHHSISDAQASLIECRAAGYQCLLVTAIHHEHEGAS